MGLPNKGEVKGKFEKVKGRVKETVGVATDNPRLRDEGRADQAEGDLREGANRLRRKVGDAIQDIGDSIRR